MLMLPVAAALALAPLEAQRDEHDEHAAHAMHHHHAPGEPLGIPDTRAGSGTAWQPDSTPMRGHHLAASPWTIMLHGALFAGYDRQSGDRGDSKWVAPGWAMAMEQRPAGGGFVTLRQMISTDPVTVGKNGAPLLLQTGESLDGAPIHDRQHPHDLFMELAAQYVRALSPAMGFEIYAAPAGEPALGPVAFPHRASAAFDPMAPLSHHWQDSTHISFGVLTLGWLFPKVKVEGSWFNGREPDENRYDLDLRRLDSWSGRVSYNPASAWSLQASYGYLASPEALHPDTGVHRLTASAMYDTSWADGGHVAATAVYGRNDTSGDPTTSSGLIEAAYEAPWRGTIFGRLEIVEKTGDDLVLPAGLESEVFTLTCVTSGYRHRLIATSTVDFGIGAALSVNAIPSGLEPFYGSRHPAGGMVFLDLRPTVMSPSMGHSMPMSPKTTP